LLDAPALPLGLDPQTATRPTSTDASVLAIDNDPAIVEVLALALGEEGYRVSSALSASEGLVHLEENRFDAVVCDLRLGALTGRDVLRRLRQADESTAFVLVSGVRDQQTAVDALRDGADDFVQKPFRIPQLRDRVRTAIGRRRAFSERLAAERRLADELQRSNEEILRRTDEIESLALRSVRSLVLSIEAKDPYTKNHSVKVARVGQAIARRLGLGCGEQRAVRLAGLLHDIGKIGIREDVLHKQGPLTPFEKAHMQQHPLIGERILLPLAAKMPELVAAVKHEHERWDGGGYPSGLRGDDIPLGARIIAVADAFDAITSDRPYRPAQPKEAAAKEIAAGAGTQFDPRVCEAFFAALSDL